MQRDELMSQIEMFPPGHALDAELISAAERQVEHEPGFSAECQRVQALDARVQAALMDVPVPGELAEQILLRLSAVDAVAGSLVRDLELPSPAHARSAWASRRRALMAAALATAAALAIYLALPAEEPPWTAEAIAMFAREQFAAGPAELRDVATDPPSSALPVSAVLAPLADMRWHEVDDFLGRSGVAYDLRRNGARAKLYVVRLRGGPRAPQIAEDALSIAPRPSSTAGSTAAVWRERDLLYVLVVQGGENEFRYFLAPAPVVA